MSNFLIDGSSTFYRDSDEVSRLFYRRMIIFLVGHSGHLAQLGVQKFLEQASTNLMQGTRPPCSCSSEQKSFLFESKNQHFFDHFHFVDEMFDFPKDLQSSHLLISAFYPDRLVTAVVGTLFGDADHCPWMLDYIASFQRKISALSFDGPMVSDKGRLAGLSSTLDSCRNE